MEKIQKFEVSLNTYDHHGNFLEFDTESKNVFIKPSGQPKRMIGQIQESEYGFTYYKKEDETHIHRKTKSWTVPRLILKEVDRIVYETDKALYEIGQKEANKVGFQSQWDDVTVDKKVYLPINAWTTTWKDATMSKRVALFGYDWYLELKSEFDQTYYSDISAFVASKLNAGTELYPALSDIHRAFRQTSPMDVSVVFIGDGPLLTKHYNGLCYSVNRNLVPKETQDIMDKVEKDYYKGFNINSTPDFVHWTTQGVLMINDSLTADASGIHQCGWDKLISAAVKALSVKKRNLVFVLWGKNTSKYKDLIDKEHHLILEPSDSAFTQANTYLRLAGNKEIHW